MVVIIILVGGGALYGGYTYGTSTAKAGPRNPMAGNFGNFAGAAGRNGIGGAGSANVSAVRGSILSTNAGTISLQLDNNAGSKIILYSTSTPITKTAEGTTNDLVSGQNIMVRGTQNSDGSVTAESIQLVPASSTVRGF